MVNPIDGLPDKWKIRQSVNRPLNNTKGNNTKSNKTKDNNTKDNIYTPKEKKRTGEI